MQQSIEIMRSQITAILSDNKPSLYLYGSVVLGDFKLGWSDIDILCLTKNPISIAQADKLMNLRQKLLELYPDNQYFRSFEGSFISLAAYLHHLPDQVVYWGTSGQRITDQYELDTFSTMELKDFGILLYGEDIREQIAYPTFEELKVAVLRHYNAIRKYAVKTDGSILATGWLLDIARCLYTLQTGKIIAKTAAGEWAIENALAPNLNVMRKVIKIRKNPEQYKNDQTILSWAKTLGGYIQEFADVLEQQLNNNTSL